MCLRRSTRGVRAQASASNGSIRPSVLAASRRAGVAWDSADACPICLIPVVAMDDSTRARGPRAVVRAGRGGADTCGAYEFRSLTATTKASDPASSSTPTAVSQRNVQRTPATRERGSLAPPIAGIVIGVWVVPRRQRLPSRPAASGKPDGAHRLASRWHRPRQIRASEPLEPRSFKRLARSGLVSVHSEVVEGLASVPARDSEVGVPVAPVDVAVHDRGAADHRAGRLVAP
jgi:hypothetical protein